MKWINASPQVLRDSHRSTTYAYYTFSLSKQTLISTQIPPLFPDSQTHHHLSHYNLPPLNICAKANSNFQVSAIEILIMIVNPFQSPFFFIWDTLINNTQVQIPRSLRFFPPDMICYGPGGFQRPH